MSELRQDGRATLAEIFAAARFGDLSAVELRLWLIVRSYDSGSGCYAATDTLAEHLGMSASHVEKRRASMVARGWLEVMHRGPLAPAVRAVVPAQALHSSEEQDPKALHLGLHSSANRVREYGKDTDGASQGPDGSPPPTPAPYTPEFEAAWAAYPRRAGGNPKKAAYRCWRARVRQGASEDELEQGVVRYARFCDATDKTGSEFVMQASRFFGPDEHWREDWAVSGGAPEPALANLQALP